MTTPTTLKTPKRESCLRVNPGSTQPEAAFKNLQQDRDPKVLTTACKEHVGRRIVESLQGGALRFVAGGKGDHAGRSLRRESTTAM